MNILDAETGGNIVSLKRPDCSQLFLVYAAAVAQVMDEGMNQMTFLRRSGLLDRNVTFIRDPDTVVTRKEIRARYYENGISPDLPDLDSVLDWQKAHIASMHHVTEVYMIGNSFGGWSAMFFGYMLAVKRVFALAPAGDWGRQLLKDLLADDNGVTEYELFYSRDIEGDRTFSETFEGYPRTRLTVRDEHGHSMMRGMLATGELKAILPPFRGVDAG